MKRIGVAGGIDCEVAANSGSEVEAIDERSAGIDFEGRA
jgi:hypothetical protein